MAFHSGQVIHSLWFDAIQMRSFLRKETHTHSERATERGGGGGAAPLPCIKYSAPVFFETQFLLLSHVKNKYNTGGIGQCRRDSRPTYFRESRVVLVVVLVIAITFGDPDHPTPPHPHPPHPHPPHPKQNSTFLHKKLVRMGAARGGIDRSMRNCLKR